MNVRHAMTEVVVNVRPRGSVVHARSLLEKHRINQLPVLVHSAKRPHVGSA
jgi:CBS-domain-containing membrane protein